jgi:excinuclease UvrABC nuclease subunit
MGIKKNDDIGSLKEILSRRFNHPEWAFPKAIVVDGGKAHKKAAKVCLLNQALVSLSWRL